MSATTTTVTPSVGTLATEGVGSDCYPCMVTAVNPSGTKIVVNGVHYELAPGANAYQDWCSANNGTLIIHGPVEGRGNVYTLRKNGRWVRQGSPMRGGSSISLGDARYHQDPHF
jgi:hypothetical protein